VEGRHATRGGWLVLPLLALSLASCVAATPGTLAGTPTPASLAVLAPTPTPTAGTFPFRVGITQLPQVAGYLLPYWVGIDGGVFPREGLAVTLVPLPSEQLAMSAVANGHVDVVVAPPSLPLLASAALVGNVVILGGTHNAFDQRLITAADITTAAELVGKAAIINAKGSLNDFQTREALRRVGIDPETQLAGYWVGPNQAERIQHLKLGNGQAIVLPPPLSTIIAKEGYTDFGDLSEGPPWPGAAIWTTRASYTSRYPYMERFIRGLFASIARTKHDPDFARELLKRYTQLDDPDGLAEAYAVYGDRLLERVPRLSVEGLQRAIDFAAQARPGVALPRAETLVDHSLVDRVAASDLLEQLYR
jgi:ABC-type nitrate/sulfonate/bicarbonate transport system substrate-binding protein